MGKKASAVPSFDHIIGLDLPLVTLPAGEVCFRIHRTSYAPLWFGPDKTIPIRGRFNAPGYEYGVCYFGMSFDVAFAETLLRNPRSRILSEDDLAERSVSAGHLTRQLHVARLHGPGLARLGISAETAHGAHPVCRRLALAIWRHPRNVDGIAYRSRFDNDELCFVLFDRAGDAIVIDHTRCLLDDDRELGRILDKYDVGLDP